VVDRGSELAVLVTANGDAELEVWGARRKATLLERTLQRAIVLEIENGVRVASA
jgi:hypothetical protein